MERADDRETAFRAARAILDGFPESPDKDQAQRLVTDRVGMTVQFRTGAVPTARAAATSRVLDAGIRLEQDALAGALAHEGLRPLLAELTPEHFYHPVLREVRAHLVDGTPLDDTGIGVLAELDARAEAEGIDEGTGTELLLRMRERELRRQLQHAEPARTRELQDALRKVLEKVGSLA
jgi:hypothetical protein